MDLYNHGRQFAFVKLGISAGLIAKALQGQAARVGKKHPMAAQLGDELFGRPSGFSRTTPNSYADIASQMHGGGWARRRAFKAQEAGREGTY